MTHPDLWAERKRDAAVRRSRERAPSPFAWRACIDCGDPVWALRDTGAPMHDSCGGPCDDTGCDP